MLWTSIFSFFSVSVSICRLSYFLLPCSLVQLEAKLVLGDEDNGWQCFFLCFFSLLFSPPSMHWLCGGGAALVGSQWRLRRCKHRWQCGRAVPPTLLPLLLLFPLFFSLCCPVPPPLFLSSHCHLSSLFFPSPVSFFFSPFVAKTACIFSFILKTFGNGPITEAIKQSAAFSSCGSCLLKQLLWRWWWIVSKETAPFHNSNEYFRFGP